MTDRVSLIEDECRRMLITVLLDSTLPTRGDEPDLMGWYDRRAREIHIAGGLSHAQKLVTLQHEYIHATHDIFHR